MKTQALNYIGASARMSHQPMLLAILTVVSLNLLPSDVCSQELVKDINRNENPSFNEYSDALDVNNTLFYTSGSELWKTTGSTASTIRLKAFQGIGNLTAVGGLLYFSANDGSGLELWKSNGTPSGTVRVKDIFPGPTGSLPEWLVAIGSTVFFIANNGITGRELWKSDGTAAGTMLVKDILKVTGGSGGAYLANVNGVLFFTANDGINGFELWKSDGTDAGTVMVKDIRSGTKVSSSPRVITNVNGVAFFTADDGIKGRELWKSNGTASGTVLVKDLIAGSASTNYQNLTTVGSILFFSANDLIHGEELWKSNGTTAGTLMVKDLTPGPLTSGRRGDFSSRMNNFRNINGKLYFEAYKNNDFYNWKSDGTEAGTVAFALCNNVGIYQVDAKYTFYKNSVFFYNGSQTNDIVSIDLMKEDAAGTVSQVSTLYLNDYYEPTISMLVKSGGYLFLTGRENPTQGHALFRSDGTAAGTQLIIDNVPMKDQSSNPEHMVTIGSTVYFTAYSLEGFTVWATNGTPAGTRSLITVDAVTTTMNANGKLAFVGWKDGSVDIYTSDGTVAGTKKIPITSRPPEYVYITELLFVNGKFILIYRGEFYDSPYYLFYADGTTSGELAQFKYVYGLTALGTTIYFGGEQAATGAELWKTDGTRAGTKMVEDILPGPTGSWPASMKPYKNQLYFSATDSVHGYELWRSNGTTSGTLMLKNTSLANNTTGYASLQNFIVVNNILYFTYDDAVNGWLWKTDGTSAGTSMIKQVDPIYRMINGNDRLYFLSSAGGYQLWSTKGTAATTQLVTDWGGAGSFQIDNDYAMIGSVLYINDRTTGVLFRSDGTACGSTSVVSSVTFSGEFEALGSNLIFSGFRQEIGQELFKLNTTTIPSPACLELSTEPLARETISSYPNPFTSEFTIEVEGVEGASYQLEIIDQVNLSTSKYKLHYNEHYLFGAQLKKGEYVLRIKENGNETLRRVIKN